MDAAVQPVDVVRVARDARAAARDVVAAEEPLEIRLGGTPFVVIMRSPGADRELAAGFLLSERIVRSAASEMSGVNINEPPAAHAETARRGNFYGMLGMAIAVLATVFGPRVTGAGIPWIIGAMVVGFLLSFIVPSTTARVACLMPIMMGFILAFKVDRRSRFAAFDPRVWPSIS